MHNNKFKRQKNNFPLLILLFLFMSIPVGVFALLNIESTDTRNRAAQLQEEYKCTISFPYVNSLTIPTESTVQVQVSANLPEEVIKNVRLVGKDGSSIFEKEYDIEVSSIQEIFTFTKTSQGEYSILGTLTSNVNSYPCVMNNNKTVMVVDGNSAPAFSTSPDQSKPSNAIKVNDSYEYTLKAGDADNDTINYSFTFSPNSTWLKRAVVENGTNGTLTLKLTGKPDKPGSYLANIFIHDGYQKHLRSQSWVISVDQDKNDIPKVTITKPTTNVTASKGEKITISWKVEDLNLITKQEVYITKSLSNESEWVKLATLTNKFGNYILDTSTLTPGNYNIIVTATDNYSTPATGKGISPIISIEDTVDPNDPDDGVVISDPQIINISPSNESEIKNRRPNITATLIASSKSEIVAQSIKITLDEKDVTDKLKVNKISDTESTIVFSPDNDLSLGAHKVKVEFKDKADKGTEKEWTFTIIEDVADNDKINIFGFEIEKKLFYIIIGGIALLLLALIIPWLLYLAWRGSNEDEEYDINTVYSQTPAPYSPTNSSVEKNEYNNFSYAPPKDDVYTPVDNNTYETKVEEKVTTNTTTETTPIEQEVKTVDKAEEYFAKKTQQYPFVVDEAKTEVTETTEIIQEQKEEEVKPIEETPIETTTKEVETVSTTQTTTTPTLNETISQPIIPTPTYNTTKETETVTTTQTTADPIETKTISEPIITPPTFTQTEKTETVSTTQTPSTPFISTPIVDNPVVTEKKIETTTTTKDTFIPEVISADEEYESPEDKQYDELLKMAEQFEYNVEDTDDKSEEKPDTQFNAPKPE